MSVQLNGRFLWIFTCCAHWRTFQTPVIHSTGWIRAFQKHLSLENKVQCFTIKQPCSVPVPGIGTVYIWFDLLAHLSDSVELAEKIILTDQMLGFIKLSLKPLTAQFKLTLNNTSIVSASVYISVKKGCGLLWTNTFIHGGATVKHPQIPKLCSGGP